MTYPSLIIKFINPPPTTPFSPTWEFSLGQNNLSKINSNRLKKFLLSKEKEVLSISEFDETAYGTCLGKDSTTARSAYYNIFEWDQEDIHIIKEHIILTHKKYYEFIVPDSKPPSINLRGWMNIMRKGEQIKKHSHGYDSRNDYTYLSGNFVVSCEEITSKTIYVNPLVYWDEKTILERIDYCGDNCLPWAYASKNIVGNLTIFPSYVPHFTTKHTSDTERITLGFEIQPYGYTEFKSGGRVSSVESMYFDE